MKVDQNDADTISSDPVQESQDTAELKTPLQQVEGRQNTVDINPLQQVGKQLKDVKRLSRQRAGQDRSKTDKTNLAQVNGDETFNLSHQNVEETRNEAAAIPGQNAGQNRSKTDRMLKPSQHQLDKGGQNETVRWLQRPETPESVADVQRAMGDSESESAMILQHTEMKKRVKAPQDTDRGEQDKTVRKPGQIAENNLSHHTTEEKKNRMDALRDEAEEGDENGTEKKPNPQNVTILYEKVKKVYGPGEEEAQTEALTVTHHTAKDNEHEADWTPHRTGKDDQSDTVMEWRHAETGDQKTGKMPGHLAEDNQSETHKKLHHTEDEYETFRIPHYMAKEQDSQTIRMQLYTEKSHHERIKSGVARTLNVPENSFNHRRIRRRGR